MTTISRISAQDDLTKIVFEIQKAKWVEASEISSENYSFDNLYNFLRNTDSIFIVAYCNEQFAGMASAKLLNKPSGNVWLYIDEIDVCEDKQKQGVGKELMNYLLKFAQEANCDEMWIGTEVDNIPANALYNSLTPSEIQLCFGYTFLINN